MSLRGRRHGGGTPRLEMITASGPLTGTFDPSITTATSTTITCDYGDGTSETLTGTTHNFSHTYAALGSWRAVFRGVPLASITGIDCTSDAVLLIKNLYRLSALENIQCSGNANISLSLSALPKNAYTLIDFGGVATVAGYLSELSSYITLKLSTTPNIYGCLSDISTIAQTVWLYNHSAGGITPGSITHLTAARDIRIYSMGWDQAGVNLVISSAWGARASYTYSSISMQIGGTNPAPSGNKVAPVEGSDWHEDTPGHWVPLTANAMVYDLLNDVNSEGFYKWFSITTS